MLIESYNDFVNESTGPIKMNNLIKYAEAIGVLCAGEYGDVWFNETENHVYICLGDSNPFDQEYLKEFMIDAIKKDYDSYKLIQVTIENECNPSGPEWKKIN